ncbi:hypothetical protein BHE74_00053101 [Ensete ventricosum]|nr:hypothetical protein BHE74_00053101 [Ensete ventricosum]
MRPPPVRPCGNWSSTFAPKDNTSPGLTQVSSLGVSREKKSIVNGFWCQIHSTTVGFDGFRHVDVRPTRNTGRPPRGAGLNRGRWPVTLGFNMQAMTYDLVDESTSGTRTEPAFSPPPSASRKDRFCDDCCKTKRLIANQSPFRTISPDLYAKQKRERKGSEPESAGILQDGHELAGDVDGDEAIDPTQQPTPHEHHREYIWPPEIYAGNLELRRLLLAQLAQSGQPLRPTTTTGFSATIRRIPPPSAPLDEDAEEEEEEADDDDGVGDLFGPSTAGGLRRFTAARVTAHDPVDPYETASCKRLLTSLVAVRSILHILLRHLWPCLLTLYFRVDRVVTTPRHASSEPLADVVSASASASKGHRRALVTSGLRRTGAGSPISALHQQTRLPVTLRRFLFLDPIGGFNRVRNNPSGSDGWQRVPPRVCVNVITRSSTG